MNMEMELIERIRTLSQPMDAIPTGLAPHTPTLTGLRCVLFDVYGTLFISGSGDVGTAGAVERSAALGEALVASGFLADPATQMSRLLIEEIKASHARSRSAGMEWPEIEIREIWTNVLTQVGLTANETQVARLTVEYEGRVNPVWPMPGVQESLDILRTRSMRLGLVSNAQFFTPFLFDALLENDLATQGFEDALCIWSYSCREAKPSLALFQRALMKLAEDGIEPNEVLYVGNDMRNDIRPAAACGCRTALFAGDQRSLRMREEDAGMEQVKPDAILTDLRQLHSLIG